MACGKQSLDDWSVALSAVSYTHLDVYKRQTVNILYRLCRFHALEAAETQAFSALNIPLATPCFAPYRSCARALLWDG